MYQQLVLFVLSSATIYAYNTFGASCGFFPVFQNCLLFLLCISKLMDHEFTYILAYLHDVLQLGDDGSGIEISAGREPFFSVCKSFNMF